MLDANLSTDIIDVPQTEKWDAYAITLNNSHDAIKANIASNMARQIPQLMPHNEQDQTLCIVGGGWSLNDTYEELRQLYFDGAKIVALNGSAKWLMERNLRPSLHVVLDSRPDNVEFVRDAIPHCRIMLASQCDPSLFDVCADRDVTIFHAITDNSADEIAMLDAYYAKRWQRVPPSGSVGITAITLCRFLGFRFQHLFGIDSCYREDGVHHAYAQPINDAEGSALFEIAGKVFRCSAWQASQARHFLDLIKLNGEHFELSIHGDGLLSYLLKRGCEMPAQSNSLEVRP